MVLFTRWPISGGGIAIFSFGCCIPMYLCIGIPGVKWFCNFEDSERILSPAAGTSVLLQEPDDFPGIDLQQLLVFSSRRKDL